MDEYPIDGIGASLIFLAAYAVQIKHVFATRETKAISYWFLFAMTIATLLFLNYFIREDVAPIIIINLLCLTCLATIGTLKFRLEKNPAR